MGNRIFTLSLVVAVGVLLGVGIVMKQAKDPLLREMIKQQGEIIDTHWHARGYLWIDDAAESRVAQACVRVGRHAGAGPVSPAVNIIA